MPTTSSRRRSPRRCASRPVIPVTGRRVAVPWRLATTASRPDTPIAISILLLHHREDLYPDPFAFRPERWLGGTTSREPTSGFRSAGGTRRCLGAALAMAEQRVVLEAMARAARPRGRRHEARAAQAPQRDDDPGARRACGRALAGLAALTTHFGKYGSSRGNRPGRLSCPPNGGNSAPALYPGDPRARTYAACRSQRSCSPARAARPPTCASTVARRRARPARAGHRGGGRGPVRARRRGHAVRPARDLLRQPRRMGGARAARRATSWRATRSASSRRWSPPVRSRERDGLELVALRGRLMQEAGDERMAGRRRRDARAAGAGAAERAPELAAAHGLRVANDNSPQQVVLSGLRSALPDAAAAASELGLRPDGT